MVKGRNRIAITYLKKIAKLTADFLKELEEENSKYSTEPTKYHFVRLTATSPWLIAKNTGKNEWVILKESKFGERLKLYETSDFHQIGEMLYFPK